MIPSDRDLIGLALDVTTALLDSGACPDCLGGECMRCAGFGQDSAGVQCPDCDGAGDAPHLDDCRLIKLHAQAYEFLYPGLTNHD